MNPDDLDNITTADEARDAAIEWSHWFSEQTLYWSDVAEWGAAFDALAERFPELTDEFRENGII